MEEEDSVKQKFQAIFKYEYEKLSLEGYASNVAAARALENAKSLLNSSVDVIGNKEPVEENAKLDLPNFIALTHDIDKNLNLVIRVIENVFSSFPSILKTFSSSKSYSSPHFELDIIKISTSYECIVGTRNELALTSLKNCLENLLSLVRQNPNLYSSNALISLTIVVLEHPELFDPVYDDLLNQLVHLVDSYSVECRKRLKIWIIHSIEEKRYRHYIALLRQYISLRVYENQFEDARKCVRFLALLYQLRTQDSTTPATANIANFSKVEVSFFYIDALNEDYLPTRAGKVTEFKLWYEDQGMIVRKRRQILKESMSRSSASSSGISNPEGNVTNASNSIESSANPTETRTESNASGAGGSVPPTSAHNPAAVTPKLRAQDVDRLLEDIPRQSFISYPFVLTPAVKALILEMDSAIQMRQEMDHEIFQAVYTGSAFAVPYLVLNVRRNNIIQDTLSQVMCFSDGDFKKPLKVVFDGEEGVDAGGLRKEFYQVMTRNLLSAEYGMFKHFEESRLLWFSADSLETSQEYELVGLLLGIAIYNSIIVDLNMPKVIYKKLKGIEPTLEDLKELEPTLGANLERLLCFEGDVQAAFDLTFQISYELYGEIINIDLRNGKRISNSDILVAGGGAQGEGITAAADGSAPHSLARGELGANAVDKDNSAPGRRISEPEVTVDSHDFHVENIGGLSLEKTKSSSDVSLSAASLLNQNAEKSTAHYAAAVNSDCGNDAVDVKMSADDVVTNENRVEYVDLYVSWILTRSVEFQFNAFMTGFKKVCGGSALDLFEPEELELLVGGSPHLDMHDLKRNTTYQDGYDAESRVIQDFWEVVLALTEAEKKLFLKFVSGSDRSPIDGLGQLNFIISKNGADDVHLPSAHTCFNHLLLPEYSSKEVLESKLLFAIQQSEGFGLR